MHTTTTTALDARRTGATRPDSLRRLAVAVLAGVLTSATACGGESTTEATTTTATATTVAPSTSASSVVPTTTPAVVVAQPTTAIDQLVGAEGARVHVRCVGEGDTTVVLIAGFEAGAEGWVNVEPAMGGRARVCSYDRPGTGTSDAAANTATFTTQAADLHALLTTIGEPGPYVVVGHSFGGAQAVTFASMYAEEVTGLVLLDASPTTWPAALCTVPDDGSDAAAMLQASCNVFLPTGNSEHLDVAAAFAEVSQIESLGSLPMAVITATNRDLPGLAEPELARLTELWNQGQHAWMALSSAAHLVSVDHTSHHIQIDQPSVVIDEITRLIP